MPSSLIGVHRGALYLRRANFRHSTLLFVADFLGPHLMGRYCSALVQFVMFHSFMRSVETRESPANGA